MHPADRAKLSRRTRVASWAWALLVLLLVQNAVGIYLNLFVALPPARDLAPLLAAYSILALHVAVGFLILGTAGVILFLAARMHRAALWLPALGSLAFSLLAFSSGVEFTVGGQDDLLSFVMELAFLGAVACDAIVLYAARGITGSAKAGGPSVAPFKE